MHPVNRVGSKLILCCFLWLPALPGFAGIWQDVQVSAKATDATPIYYRSLRADHDALRQALAAAPLEYTSSQGTEIQLPMPDGSLQRFEVENSPIMQPALAARYPEIQTYRARGIDDPAATGRLDLTPKGFHGMLSSSAGTLYIDPDGSGGYRSYYRKDYVAASKGITAEGERAQCLVESSADELQAARPAELLAQRIEGSRQIYRLALAATGEYTQYHGGTVAAALAAMTTAINRVNEIYARDLAIRFELIANEELIIFTDADQDPYTNDDPVEMLKENQQTLDAVIGSQNYDIGHVFSTGGGGLAGVGVTCRTGVKAQGVTGLRTPVGDYFYIDFVAHEMGHQMAATHTFNGTTDACGTSAARIAETAFEPGSGSTILSYAGICGAENLQTTVDDLFHAISIQQISTYAGSTGACGADESTFNTAPIVSAGIDRIIPHCTPFVLHGSATDADLDVLQYQWDEMDAGAATDALTYGTDLGSNPLFRSYNLQASGERVFPRMSALAQGTSYEGETLPAEARTMNFRLTVRDGNGGVGEDDVRVAVDGGLGPFLVSGGELNAGGSFQPDSRATVEWLDGNTAASCPQVVISILAFNSSGTTYCDASNDTALSLGEFSNTGSALVTLPDLSISRGRIKVACANNVYFSLSENDLQIAGTTLVSTDCKDTQPRISDGSGDLVAACIAQGNASLPADSSGGGGGGGALILLPALLGFRLARQRFGKASRSVVV